NRRVVIGSSRGWEHLGDAQSSGWLTTSSPATKAPYGPRGVTVQTETRASQSQGLRGSGILPSQTLRELIAAGEILSEDQTLLEQVQPASLDLQLGSVAYRVRASFLPGPDRTVAQRIDEMAMHEIDLTRGAVLETG